MVGENRPKCKSNEFFQDLSNRLFEDPSIYIVHRLCIAKT